MLGFFETRNPSTWSTTDKDASISVSGLTVSGGGSASFVSARCIQKLAPNQKFYMEFTVVATAKNFGCGVANANATLSNYLGSDTNGVTFYDGGLFSYGGAQGGLADAAATGDVVCLAIDGINGNIWMRKNNNGWNSDVITNQNPALNLGGFACSAAFGLPVMIGYTSNASSGESLTLNGGSTAFAFVPPLGFRSPNSMVTK